jgi:acyl-CoA thioester hydrolase
MTPASASTHTREIALRWKDNDVYGHVNNVEYYSFFDTIINDYLIVEGQLDIHDGATIGLCAESHCTFKAPAAFPGVIRASMSVAHLGTSSVRYELRLEDAGDGRLLAEGWFVHVFVDRQTRRPATLPGSVRSALEKLA